MRRNLAGGNQFVANRTGKRQVGDVAAVEVADLAIADSKFASAESVRSGRHARPAQEFALDGLTDLNIRFHFCLPLVCSESAIRPALANSDESLQPPPRALMSWTEAMSLSPVNCALERSAESASRLASTTSM